MAFSEAPLPIRPSAILASPVAGVLTFLVAPDPANPDVIGMIVSIDPSEAGPIGNSSGGVESSASEGPVACRALWPCTE